MTRSKIEFATILASMRGQDEDPKQLAKDMSLRKLCYEIEKLEQEQESMKEAVPAVATSQKEEAPKKKKGPRPFWSWLIADSDDEDS